MYDFLRHIRFYFIDEEVDEFFDCRENFDETSSLAKWSSMDLLPMGGSGDMAGTSIEVTPELKQRSSLQPALQNRAIEPTITVRRVHSLHMSTNTSPVPPQAKPPNSAAPQFRFSKPSVDTPDVDEGEWYA